MESEVMLKFNSNIYSKLNQMAKEYNISSVEEIANLILEERVMYEDIDFLSEHETEKRLKDLRRRALSEIQSSLRMRNRKISTLLDKKFDKLKGKELLNVLDKIDEVSSNDNLFHYKNLKNPMQKYRRVHVNSSFVLLFFLFENCIYFVDYKHHDEAYLKSKKEVKKYDNLNFRDFN